MRRNVADDRGGVAVFGFGREPLSVIISGFGKIVPFRRVHDTGSGVGRRRTRTERPTGGGIDERTLFIEFGIFFGIELEIPVFQELVIDFGGRVVVIVVLVVIVCAAAGSKYADRKRERHCDGKRRYRTLFPFSFEKKFSHKTSFISDGTRIRYRPLFLAILLYSNIK